MIICVHINGAFGQINACLPQWTTLKTIRTTIRVFLTPLFITDSTSRPIWLDDGCGVDGVQSDVASHQEVEHRAWADQQEIFCHTYQALIHFNAVNRHIVSKVLCSPMSHLKLFVWPPPPLHLSCTWCCLVKQFRSFNTKTLTQTVLTLTRTAIAIRLTPI